MYDAIRREITQEILTWRLANQPALAIVFGDDPFDWGNPPPLFMAVEIEFMEAAQVGLSANPFSRDYGMVTVSVRAKEGQGDGQALRLLDLLRPALEYLQIDLPLVAGVHFREMRLSGSRCQNGWRMLDATVNFYADPFK